jgi:hypothetical protein
LKTHMKRNRRLLLEEKNRLELEMVLIRGTVDMGELSSRE